MRSIDWLYESYPLEIILRYREKEDAGDFRRLVIEHHPVDLVSDRCKLNCGHEENLAYSTFQRIEGKPEQVTKTCYTCTAEWLKAESSKS